MTEELKPCPFCGGEASIRREDDTWIVECKNHGWSDADEDGCRYAGDIALYVQINGTLNHWTYEIVYLEKDVEAARLKAIAAWNRRAGRTCGVWRGYPSPEHITNFEAHEDDELWCEHCDIELDEEWSYCPFCGAKVVDE